MFPGTVEDTERYFLRLRRLNRGLDTRHWRVYERKEEPNGIRLVLSTFTTSVTALEGMGWRPFSGVVQAIFSFPSGCQTGREEIGREEEEEAEGDMVSSISLGQRAAQHCCF
jgi:hypothetical protein